MSGLLIVNADDFGLTDRDTEAIVACLAAGAVSSATAMVHMAGEARAAQLGADSDLPLGLHVNLVEPFDAADVPGDVRETQRAIAAKLTDARAGRWLYRPGLGALIRASVGHQLARFRALYGREPTHLDGHRHMHVAPTVLCAGAFPRELPLRRPFTFERGEKPWPLLAARAALGRAVARRHPTTDFFYGLDDLWPALGGRGLERKLDRAASASVEVMVHPGAAGDYEVLLSAAWTQALHARPLGSFGDLARRSVQSGGRLR